MYWHLAVKLLFQFVLMKLDFFQSPCASFLPLMTTSHVPMSSCDSSHLPYGVTFFKNNEHKKINREKKATTLNNNLQKNVPGKLNKDSIG